MLLLVMNWPSQSPLALSGNLGYSRSHTTQVQHTRMLNTASSLFIFILDAVIYRPCCLRSIWIVSVRSSYSDKRKSTCDKLILWQLIDPSYCIRIMEVDMGVRRVTLDFTFQGLKNLATLHDEVDVIAKLCPFLLYKDYFASLWETRQVLCYAGDVLWMFCTKLHTCS
jgi:hypothetical protein